MNDNVKYNIRGIYMYKIYEPKIDYKRRKVMYERVLPF